MKVRILRQPNTARPDLCIALFPMVILVTVRLLLDRAADINAIDNFKPYPLMCISESLSIEILQMLLDGGADILARISGVTRRRLLSIRLREADIRTRASGPSRRRLLPTERKEAAIPSTRPGLSNVLHLVIGSGAKGRAKNRIVRILLERGANLYQADMYSLTPSDLIGANDSALRDVIKAFMKKEKAGTGLFSQMLSG